MPAFTFEKLSAPTSGGSAPEPAEKPRGALADLVNRLVESRRRRASRDQSESGSGQVKPKA